MVLTTHCTAAVAATTMAMRRIRRRMPGISTWPGPTIRSMARPISTGTYSVSATVTAASSTDSATSPI